MTDAHPVATDEILSPRQTKQPPRQEFHRRRSDELLRLGRKGFRSTDNVELGLGDVSSRDYVARCETNITTAV